MMSAAVEFVKSSYSTRILNSYTIGDVLALFRNTSTDIIEASDLAKFNLMNYAAGNVNHPVTY